MLIKAETEANEENKPQIPYMTVEAVEIEPRAEVVLNSWLYLLSVQF